MNQLRFLLNNHIFMSAFYKAISGLCLFISIPLLILYLGNTNFGVWILVFTLFQWILLMDFGLSSVLKTEIPKLQHTGNTQLVNAYIKSTYQICCYISLVMFLLSTVIFLTFDIQSLLNISFDRSFVVKLFLINIFFFCVNFVLNTHKALFISVHKGKFSEQSIAVNQVVFLLMLVIPLVFFPSLTAESKLYFISCINGLVCILINIIYTVYFFRTEKFTLFNTEKTPKKYLNSIYSLGFKYMIIQVGTLFLFSSDNYILAYFFGPKEIVPYEIVTKYFQFPLMILTAGMAPLWSLFANKYLENNKTWLKISFRKFNSYYPLLLLGIALCLLFANPIMKIWISNDFFAPHFLLTMVAILTSLRIFTTFYSYFFNGIGNLKSYLILLSLSVVLKIPLSYLFIRLNFGISSVVLSSITCLLIWCIVQPLEAYKIVSNIKKNE
jgi:O-antigen/teichoic acid export membrane protein